MVYVSYMLIFCFLLWFSKVIIIVVNSYRVEPKHYSVYHAVIFGISGFFLSLLFERSGLP
jgi:hypothetical protein